MVTHPGLSMAKGPAALIGLALAIAGLLALLHDSRFTPLAEFPNGSPVGSTLAGIELNGWTGWLTVAAGVLLLFGATGHIGAKMMSLVVGIALIAAAALAVIQGDVLGLAAANWLTALTWGLVGLVLVANTFSPRRTRRREVAFPDAAAPAPAAPAPAAPAAPRRADTEPVADGVPADRTTVVDEPAPPDEPRTVSLPRDDGPRRIF